MRGLAAAVAVVALVCACGDDDGGSTTPADASPTVADAAAEADAGAVEQRPYALFVPTGYNEATPAPLILALHGASQPGLGEGFADQLRLFQGAEARTWLIASPDGIEPSGTGCCRWNTSREPDEADDVAYLAAVLDDVQARYNVDPARIHVVGFSSGGFMAYVLACAQSARLASVTALAGNLWTDAAFCTPTAPLSVLQIHGDADDVVGIAGGMTTNGIAYRSAVDTLAFWADHNGCTGTLEQTGNVFNVMAELGADAIELETAESTYGGCPTGLAVSFWPAQNQNHNITVNPTTMPGLLLDFLDAHPKP